MGKLRHKCWTKATDRESGPPRRSAAWVSARRAWFKVFDDRIECGDWVIPVPSIQQAVLFETKQLFIPVFVLQISTDESTYQFGFNPWCRVIRCLPFEVERREIKLGYSVFSLGLRIVVAIALIYWLWQQFG